MCCQLVNDDNQGKLEGKSRATCLPQPCTVMSTMPEFCGHAHPCELQLPLLMLLRKSWSSEHRLAQVPPQEVVS